MPDWVFTCCHTLRQIQLAVIIIKMLFQTVFGFLSLKLYSQKFCNCSILITRIPIYLSTLQKLSFWLLLLLSVFGEKCLRWLVLISAGWLKSFARFVRNTPTRSAGVSRAIVRGAVWVNVRRKCDSRNKMLVEGWGKKGEGFQQVFRSKVAWIKA